MNAESGRLASIDRKLTASLLVAGGGAYLMHRKVGRLESHLSHLNDSVTDVHESVNQVHEVLESERLTREAQTALRNILFEVRQFAASQVKQMTDPVARVTGALFLLDTLDDHGVTTSSLDEIRDKEYLTATIAELGEIGSSEPEDVHEIAQEILGAYDRRQVAESALAIAEEGYGQILSNLMPSSEAIGSGATRLSSAGPKGCLPTIIFFGILWVFRRAIGIALGVAAGISLISVIAYVVIKGLGVVKKQVNTLGDVGFTVPPMATSESESAGPRPKTFGQLATFADGCIQECATQLDQLIKSHPEVAGIL